MSYSPRPGSQADKAIRHICDSGRALRTNEIAEATGIPAANLTSILAPAVSAGMLVACRIEQPGKHPMNEYRAGHGVPPITERPELTRPTAKVPPARPSMTGGLHLDPPALAPSGALAPRPAAKVAPNSTGARSLAGDIKLAIDDDGALRVRIDDDTLDFTPAHTTALGDFLTLTEGLWRP